MEQAIRHEYRICEGDMLHSAGQFHLIGTYSRGQNLAQRLKELNPVILSLSDF